MASLLVVGTLSTAVGSASAAGWLAPQNVPLSVSDLGFDENGNAIAVGVGAASSGASSFRSMVRPFGGQWSVTPLPVSGIGDSDVRGPQVAVDPHGNAVAVWSADNQDTTTRILRASTRPAGGAWTEPVAISDTDNPVSPRDQDVAIDAQGNATAIWSELTGGGFVVRSATRPSGGTWSDPVDLSEGAVNVQPRLAIDPQGNVTAVWLGTAPHSSGTGVVPVVRSSRRPAGGAWGSAVALSSVDGTVSAESPQVAVDAQGTATAVWGSFSSGGGYVAQTARRVAAGSWSPADDLGPGQSPQVAVDPQGNATAVWVLSDASSSIVYSRSRTGAGPWSNATPMAAGDDTYAVGYPWVAADPQGNVTAIWARYNLTDVIAQATRHVAGSSSWGANADLTVGRPITAIPAAGIDPQGHVSMVWSSSEDPWSGASSIFDPIPPTLGTITSTASKVYVGGTFGMSVNPSDAWSPVTVTWDFGDGQTATGNAVTHAYTSPGQRTITVTGVDGEGNTAQASQTLTIDPAPVLPKPGPGPNPKPRTTPKAPVLSSLKQSNPRWRTHSVRRGPKLPVGTTFRFKLDRAAQVRFAFSQIVSGRRVGGRCVKATKNNRRKPRCSRALAAGTLRVSGKAGANSVAFSGKISGRALKPGSYRLLVTAQADGKTSSAKSIRFAIAR